MTSTEAADSEAADSEAGDGDASGDCEVIRAAFVYVGPIGDAGWTYQHDLGRLQLEKETGVTTSYVENVPETLTFYERAFGLKRRMLHESGDYAELGTGTTSLSFSSLKLMADLGKSPARANLRAPDRWQH